MRPILLPSSPECARVFHTGGARLVLCGKNWERLQSLYDALISVADPSKVRPSGSQHGQPLGTLKSSCLSQSSSGWNLVIALGKCNLDTADLRVDSFWPLTTPKISSLASEPHPILFKSDSEDPEDTVCHRYHSVYKFSWLTFKIILKIISPSKRDFPGGPVVRTHRGHCWGHVQSLAGKLRLLKPRCAVPSFFTSLKEIREMMSPSTKLYSRQTHFNEAGVFNAFLDHCLRNCFQSSL